MKKLLLGLLIVSQFDAVLAKSQNWRDRIETCYHCDGSGTVTHTARHNSAIVDLFGYIFISSNGGLLQKGNCATPGIDSWTISLYYPSEIEDNIKYVDLNISVYQLREYFYKGIYNPDFINLPKNTPGFICFKDQDGNYRYTTTWVNELCTLIEKRMYWGIKKQNAKNAWYAFLNKIGL